MANYKETHRHQTTLVAISLADQIQPGTFEYAIDYLIERQLDLSQFEKRYNNDSGGAKAYHPKVLLKIVLLAYSRGTTSSRVIARCCRTNATFMALSGFREPHFTTIAHFVSQLEREIVDLFQQVLLVCDESGLLDKKMFAIDGCKLPSNASKEWSGTHEELERKKVKMETAVKRMVAKHKQSDGSEGEEQIKERELKQIQTLKNNAAKIEKFLAENEPRIGRRGKEVKSNITDNESAKMKTSHGVIQGYIGIATADEKHQIIVQAEAHGIGQEQGILEPSITELKTNLQTLPGRNKKGAVLKGIKLLADSGYHSEDNLKLLSGQGIDGYIADNKFRKRDPRFAEADRHKPKKQQRSNRRFKADDFIHDQEDQNCICPAGKSLWLKNKQARIGDGIYETYQGYRTDCRPCELKSNCLGKPNQMDGRQVSFRVGTTPKPRTLTQRMISKIDSVQGRYTYSKRLGMIEPVFGNIRENKGLRRFSFRGKAKVDMQWKLFCMIHNIEKLKNYGCTT